MWSHLSLRWFIEWIQKLNSWDINEIFHISFNFRVGEWIDKIYADFSLSFFWKSMRIFLLLSFQKRTNAITFLYMETSTISHRTITADYHAQISVTDTFPGIYVIRYLCNHYNNPSENLQLDSYSCYTSYSIPQYTQCVHTYTIDTNLEIKIGKRLIEMKCVHTYINQLH